jgi:hypothetical protein
MFRPRIGFDAFLRITEMIALQFMFYFIYFFVVMLLDDFYGVPYTHDQLFNYGIVHFSSTLGRIAIIGQFLGGLASAILFSFLEGRSRNALDFISTTFGLHLLVISVICYFPKSFFWWVSYLASWSVSLVVAESISMKFEMQDINLDVALPAILERVRDPDAHL